MGHCAACTTEALALVPLKRNVVVDRPGAAAGGERRPAIGARGLAEARALAALLVGEALAVGAAAAGVEQLQFAAEALQHDLGRVAVGARLVLPLAGLELALDIDLGALLAVLLRHLAEVLVEDHDVVPLGLFLALARGLVAPGLRGRDREVHHLIAGIEPTD